MVSVPELLHFTANLLYCLYDPMAELTHLISVDGEQSLSIRCAANA